jgi:ketosteroid isomerase-like protein
MSQENLDLLRRGFEHVERTGELLRELTHPDFVWDTTTFRGGLNRKTCIGVDETNSWLAQWIEEFDNWSVDVEEVVEAGDQMVTTVRQHARAKHGGPEVEMRFAQVWTFRDGLLARMEMYADRDEALEAAGLRERVMSQESQKSGAKPKLRPVNGGERQYRVRPECRAKAQEAVAQMRALGLRVELQRGDLLVFTVEDTIIDHRVGETLERVWPGWRECVSD